MSEISHSHAMLAEVLVKQYALIAAIHAKTNIEAIIDEIMADPETNKVMLLGLGALYEGQLVAVAQQSHTPYATVVAAAREVGLSALAEHGITIMEGQ